MHHGQRIARLDSSAHRRLDDDAGGVVNPVVLLLAADAELEPRQPDLQSVDRLHVAGGRRRHRKLERRHRQPLLQPAALGGEHAQESVPAGARSEGFVRVRVDLSQPAHLTRDDQRDLNQLLVSLPGQCVQRLLNLERVADRATERVVHGGDECDGPAACAFAQLHHLGGQLDRGLDVGHEGPATELDVEHDRVRARGDLLRHHTGRDERHGRHGRRHVPQGVQGLVGRHHVGRLGRHRDPDLLDLPDEALGLQVHGESWNGLELVERPARVGESAAAELRDLDPARGRKGRRDQGDLVANPACRVLVDLDSFDPAQVEHLAAGHHGLRQGKCLGAGHATDAHRHQPGRHLVVGNLATQVAGEQKFDLFGRVFRTVSLAADDLEWNHCRLSFHTSREGQWASATIRPDPSGVAPGCGQVFERELLGWGRRGFDYLVWWLWH